jgi:ribulose-phosphate 3-epimerase
MNVPIVAPSVLAADFGNLARDVEMINQSEADWIHIDIMDGTFVPNFSMGIPVVEAIRRHAKKFLDVHLMIVNPEHHVEAFQKAGAQNISVHIEVCRNMHRNIQQIRALGCNVGIALNPHTPTNTLEDVIQDVDVVCVMSVNPGFGAQTFIPHTYTKVRQLRDMITKSSSTAKIEIDGGVNLSNARELLEAGANILVAGNFVFSSADPVATISKLKNL